MSGTYKPKRLWNLGQLQDALLSTAEMIRWERETLEDFHHFSHEFGGSPGGNVFEFVLQDALRHRGMTRGQLREKHRP